MEDFQDVSVFSAGNSNASVGLSFALDVCVTHFLEEDEIGLLHEQMANAHPDKIRAETEPATENEAATITFDEHFWQRRQVEQRLVNAVQQTWASHQLHIALDHLFPGRIRITNQVAQKQLGARIQNEINQREDYLQQAEVKRQRTQIQVNLIQLRAQKALETAQAEAGAIQKQAVTGACQIEAEAQTNGTLQFFQEAVI